MTQETLSQQQQTMPENQAISAPQAEGAAAVSSENSAAPAGFWQRIRTKAVSAMPRVIVNNSSNVIGMTQLVAEAQMFKAGGVNFFEADLAKRNTNKLLSKIKPTNPVNYVVEPVVSVLNSVFGKAKTEIKVKELFDPKFLKEELRNFNNLERAALRDSANGSKRLINRFSSRSGFSGMLAMTVATVFPDEKDTEETTLANATLVKENPLRYAATRFGQALWFPAEATIRIAKRIANPGVDQHVGEHKRQFSGLGMMSAGVFSIFSGFRQIENKWPERQYYMRNPWQMIGGAVTAIAGVFLMMGIDNRQGWTQFGTTQFFRLPTLVGSVATRFKAGDHGGAEQGRYWYLSGQITLQIKNVIASLLGGSEKRGDGTVVDHKAILEEAKREAKAKVTSERKNTSLSEAPDGKEAASLIDQAGTQLPASAVPQDNSVAFPTPGKIPRHDSPLPQTRISKITPEQRLEAQAQAQEMAV